MLRFSVIAALPFLLSSFLSFSSAYTNDPSACPESWNHWEGFCYLLQESTSPWQEAQTQCMLNGGGLVTLSSRRQLHFLSRLVEDQPITPMGTLWLGCKRERNQPSWFCLDGKPLYGGSHHDHVWAEHEPHVDRSSPAAVVLKTREGTMMDSSPTDNHYSMCQKLILPDSSRKSTSLGFHRVFQNFILKGHSILATPQPSSRLVCSALCLDTTECVSFNLLANGTCELNAMDWRHCGDGVFEREFGAQYFEPIYHT